MKVNIQKLISDRIDFLIKNAADESPKEKFTPTIIKNFKDSKNSAGESPEEKGVKTSEQLVPAITRNFEDFVDGMDDMLRRRLWDSDKFHANVQQIRNAIRSGEFVINVVAQEYSRYKKLVDLIVDQALTEAVPLGKISSPEVSKAQREEVQERRYQRMNNSIVGDVDIKSILSNPPPPASTYDSISAMILQRFFFGSSYFNPNDPINCCYSYVLDYLRSPIPSDAAREAGQDLNDRDMLRYGYKNPDDPASNVVGRDSSLYGYKEFEKMKRQMSFNDKKALKHKVKFRNPQRAPSFNSGRIEFPGIYFDERVGHFRRDPRNEKSYLYENKTREAIEIENAALERFERLVDEGFQDPNDPLNKKWLIFVKLLSMIQGCGNISIFHSSGFDESGNPRVNVATETEVKLPEVTHDLILSIMSSFLGSIGVKSGDIASQLTDAIVTPDLSSETKKASINIFKENNLTKQALTETVEKSDVYKRILKVLEDNKKDMSFLFIKGISAEYVIDLLIKFLQKNITEVQHFSSPKNVVPKDGIESASLFAYLSLSEDDAIKLGFSSIKDMEENLNNQTLKIVSKEGFIESVLVDHVEYDGNYVMIKFQKAVVGDYVAGEYSISFDEYDTSISGITTDLYIALYGDSAPSVMSKHKENGIELNISIYPSWVPSPFDFRELSEASGIGHPNNAYYVKKALDERVALRERLSRKMSQDSRGESSIVSAIQVIDQEIAEISYVLYGFVVHQYSDSISEGSTGKFDTGKSLMRSVGDRSRFDFFREVQERCRKNGINIGNFNENVTEQALMTILTKEEFDIFKKIKENVEKELAKNRSFVILRGIDQVSATFGSNGFLSKNNKVDSSEGKSVSYVETEASSVFESNLKMVQEEITSKLPSQEANRSHVIIITSTPVPDSICKTKIYVSTSTISKEEIAIIVDFCVKQAIKDNKDPDAIKFAVYNSIIKRMQKKLSGLDFDNVFNFIKSTVDNLFSDFLKTKDLSKTSLLMEPGINAEMDNLEKSNTRIPEGTKFEAPRFTVADYATKVGSEWAKWVDDNVRKMGDRIDDNNRKINFFRRCIDTGIYFGSYKMETSKDGKGTNIRFNFNETDNGNLVWFSENPKTFASKNMRPDNVVERLSTEASFNISKNVYDVLSSDPKYVSNPLTPRIISSNIEKYKKALYASIKRLELDIDQIKRNFPPIMCLEGAPGTGKSIFGDVLASTLDCKYIKTNFSQIGFAGKSSFRGVVEENFRRFLDICREAHDTVILIDEFDFFLVKVRDQLNGGEARDLLEKLLKSWDEDLSTYKQHNTHIILTTNNLNTVKDLSSALMSRISKSGKPHKVELPGDARSLATLFSGGGMWTSLLFERLSQEYHHLFVPIKELISLYDSSDPNDQALVKVIVGRLLEADPAVFTKTILRPLAAKNVWSTNRNLKKREDVDQVEEFVRGWKMVEQLLSGMNENVEIPLSDGNVEKINPMELICKKFSEKMFFRSKSSGKQYELTTIRELVGLIVRILDSHQSFMEGDDVALPFNWKTMLSVVEGTNYTELQDKNVKLSDVEIAELNSRKSEGSNGWDSLERFSRMKGPNGESIPREFWMTREQYVEEIYRNAKYTSESEVERNNDKGFATLIEIIESGLYFKNPRIETGMKSLFQFVMEKGQKGQSPANHIYAYLNAYENLRSKIKQIYDQTIPKIDSMNQQSKANVQNLLIGQNPDGVLRELIIDYKSFESSWEIPSINYFANNKDNRSLSFTWKSFLELMKQVKRTVSSIDSLNFSVSESDISSSWGQIVDQARPIMSLDQNTSLKLFADIYIMDGSLDRNRYEVLTEGMKEQSYVPPSVLKTMPVKPAEKPPTEKVVEPSEAEEQSTLDPSIPSRNSDIPLDITGLAPQGDDFEDVDLSKKTSTDYYYKYAREIVLSQKLQAKKIVDENKKVRVAQVAPQNVQQNPNLDYGATVIVKSGIAESIKANENRIKALAKMSHGIYSENPTNDFQILYFN